MKHFVATFLAILSMCAAHAAESADAKLTRYHQLAKEERWAEALPLIEEIVRAAPGVATSWFNRGVCLEALSRHKLAAESFQKAYALDRRDYGAQYRAFRALSLARDFAAFARFLEQEAKVMPEIFDLLKEDEIFSDALSSKEVADVFARRKKG